MAKQSDDLGRTVSYVVLGIVGVMAIVALVLLFNNAQATGQLSRGYYSYDGAFAAKQSNFQSVAGERAGLAPEPLNWEQRVADAAAGGSAAQR